MDPGRADGARAFRALMSWHGSLGPRAPLFWPLLLRLAAAGAGAWGMSGKRLASEALAGHAPAGGLWDLPLPCPLPVDILPPPAVPRNLAASLGLSLADLADAGALLGPLHEAISGGPGPATHRRDWGSYYTPGHVVSSLTGRALSVALAKAGALPLVLDPAVGDGRFLLCALAWLQRRHPQQDPRVLAEGLLGVDISPVAVAVARLRLWLACGAPTGPWPQLEANVRLGHSLLGRTRPGDPPGHPAGLDWPGCFPQAWTGPRDGFDVILSNPPYSVLKGHRRRPWLEEEARFYRTGGLYRHALGGNLNTYRLFVERALQLASPAGQLGLVLPFSLWMDRTSKGLRGHLLASGRVLHLECFAESRKLFPGAGQATSLLHLSKGHPADNIPFRHHGRSGTTRDLLPVADLATLDPDRPLVLAPAGRRRLFIGLQASPRSTTFGRLAQGGEGEVHQTQFRACFASATSGSCLVVGRHLKPFLADLCPSGASPRWLDGAAFESRGGKAAAAVPRIAQLGIRNMETVPRLIAAIVPPGTALGNSVNYWLPTQGHDLYFLLALLNSRLLDARFRLTSSNNNINCYEVARLPVPAVAPGSRLEQELAALARSAANDAARGEAAAVQDGIARIDKRLAQWWDVDLGILLGG